MPGAVLIRDTGYEHGARADAYAQPMTARRARNRWGWGFEDAVIPRGRGARGRAACRSELLGFPADELEEPVALERATLPAVAGRGARRRARRDLLAGRPRRARMHAYGKSYLDTIRAFRGDYEHAPDVVAVRARRARRRGRPRVGGGRERRGDPLRRRHERRRRRRGARPGALRRRRLARPRRARPRCSRSTPSRAPRASARARAGRGSSEQLGAHGLTLRFYPQSFELSTLGGWIATRAGGHFATGPTHIDDLVESVRAITPSGRVGVAAPAGVGRRARARTGC